MSKSFLVVKVVANYRNSISARCTSAAPGYFKPFVADRREGTTREFIDGGLKLNNPSLAAYHEARSAFEDGPAKVIDILVSIGSARNSHVEEKLNSSPTGAWQPLRIKGFQNVLKLVQNQIQVSLETERMWQDLVRDETIPSWQRQRFRRLNPDIGYGPPSLDDVRGMPLLMNTTSRVLDDALLEPIKQVTRELVASSFYFEQSSYTWSEAEGVFKCKGKSFRDLRGYPVTKYFSFRNYPLPISQQDGGKSFHRNQRCGRLHRQMRVEAVLPRFLGRIERLG